MSERIFIVTNRDGLFVRSKQGTSLGSITVVGKMSQGEGFIAQDVFTLGNETWARISLGDGVVQEYVCVSIRNRIFCREQMASPPVTPLPGAWAQSVDAFLREKFGYTGPCL